MAAKTILTLTCNPCIDKGFSVERVLPDKKLRATDIRRDPGGGGINVSRVIKRLGGETVAWGMAGGAAGEMLKRLLDAESITYRFVPIRGETRINTTVFERATGAEYRFSMPGPRVSEDELDLLLSIIHAIEEKFAMVVFSGSLQPDIPGDFYARLIAGAHKAGIKTLVDASGESLLEALTARPFLIKPNRSELEALVQHPVSGTAEALAAAREVIARGREMVLVSLGADGAIAVTADRAFCANAPPVVAKSRVCAGDSLMGAFALKLAQEAPLPEALAYGVAAGSAAALTPGTELCRAEDVRAVLPQVDVDEL